MPGKDESPISASESPDRREFVRLAGIGLGAICIGESLTNIRHIWASGPDDYLSGRRLYQDIVTYCNLGEHRTGTKEDLITRDWLTAQLKQAGLKVETHPFSTWQFFVDKVSLRVEGKAIEAFPLWQPQATAKPVEAPLVLAGDDADQSAASLKGGVALIRFGAVAGGGTAALQSLKAAAAAGAVGAVGIYETQSGELFGHNLYQPMPLPTVVAGAKDFTVLKQAAERRAKASLLIAGKADPQAQAFEVVGKLERGKKLIVISTPYSAWFRAAGERGPGIALWLALARWAAQRKTETSYLFVASSGHELRGAGITSFVEHHAPKPDAVHCWCHLGASIAAYDYERTPSGFKKLNRASNACRLMTNRNEFLPILTAAFQGVAHLKPTYNERPAGELILMVQKGYRAFGFAGSHPYFHAPNDLPEIATGPEILEPVAQALVKTMTTIEMEVAR